MEIINEKNERISRTPFASGIALIDIRLGNVDKDYAIWVLRARPDQYPVRIKKIVLNMTNIGAADSTLMKVSLKLVNNSWNADPNDGLIIRKNSNFFDFITESNKIIAYDIAAGEALGVGASNYGTLGVLYGRRNDTVTQLVFDFKKPNELFDAFKLNSDGESLCIMTEEAGITGDIIYGYVEFDLENEKN